MAEKKTTEKTVDKKASEKKAAEEPDELARAVEKVLSDQTIVPQVVKSSASTRPNRESTMP